ncbi:signal peptidase II [Phyllobacterium sp. 21LDTY02-6]|jgi:signal peptidase II|uniref:signal peptidase II n=1 Tax=unclassified Phyllobacterium TaxID=2638441 RepID=UPI0020223B7C|nr:MULTISPECIES: signal peptidase II [unclassified Phyllobacterium]MCO4317032.1 signal peptidase II [Phyllobacterium sp. 21LDTY02-6]MCX8278596.1 signal peptidase II [Phyllobacterium sp. 0TCS1.6C]MCX8293574.1 signal peptidase II [Phyllobacterium sp. 0TCS1.6A]
MKDNRFQSLALILVLAVASDQIVKYLVETGMDYRQQIDILPFLALFRVHNDGIAFSMLSDLHDTALIVLTLAVIGFVSYLWWTTATARWISRAGFALIIGGALGNLIDRSLHGYVIDYVLFHLPSWSFAVFNLADAYISIGAALVILEELAVWLRERRARSGE